jgi:1-acyl-sn-glycerol-3-phosphate acyltransferase
MPSFYFYRRLFSLLLEASRLAKRGRFDRRQLFRSTFGVLEALEGVGVRFEISGTERFRGLGGPCVFVANHMSALETFILPAIIAPFKDLTVVIKKSLAENYPVYKHIMRAMDPITVSRTNPREDLKAVLEGGTEGLKAGRSVLVFPQATRSTVFNPKDFNTLGIKLARRANAPVIAVAIRSDAWGNGKVIKDLGKIDPSKTVHLSFGRPLWIKGRGDEEHGDVLDFINQRLKEWGL